MFWESFDFAEAPRYISLCRMQGRPRSFIECGRAIFGSSVSASGNPAPGYSNKEPDGEIRRTNEATNAQRRSHRCSFPIRSIALSTRTGRFVLRGQGDQVVRERMDLDPWRSEPDRPREGGRRWIASWPANTGGWRSNGPTRNSRDRKTQEFQLSRSSHSLEESQERLGCKTQPRGDLSKGLILAQNERWRRGLGMQVGRSARGEAQG
jgi:hypothetical protein